MPARSRTILLATNSSQSIIAEVADGTVNSIGYSAYGEQSGQHPVATKLGFNGQLRESKIGWYLLGNGYRAYNPRLMRFHSPDSWSPFGGGGLNAYMYCVGDPVNRSDPTGHVPWVEPWLKKGAMNTFNFLFGGSEITGPSRSQAIKATLSTGKRMSRETGDLAAMSKAGKTLYEEAPSINKSGASPPLGDGNTNSVVWGTTEPFVPTPARPKVAQGRGVQVTNQNPPPYKHPTPYKEARQQMDYTAKSLDAFAEGANKYYTVARMSMEPQNHVHRSTTHPTSTRLPALYMANRQDEANSRANALELVRMTQRNLRNGINAPERAARWGVEDARAAQGPWAWSRGR